jgi:predicted RNase H-like HicB family nuclease
VARYIAFVDEADGAYGVVFPDAPGCYAMGDTHEEAILNAAEALAEWASDEIASGRDVSKPRGIESLLADKKLAKDMKGRVMAMVPLVLDAGRPARANISIDAGLLAEADIAARAHGVTRSAFFAAAVRSLIKAG